MVKTQGVVHFSLPVTNLERGAKFYSELLGMRVVETTARMVFLDCGGQYLILGKIPKTLSPDPNTPVHHAFKIGAQDFDAALEFLKSKGVEILREEDRREGVFPGRQAYFFDPDGNKLELHD